MQFFKNKSIFFFIILITFSIILPFYSYGTNTTSYVWSEISSPIVTTSSLLSESER